MKTISAVLAFFGFFLALSSAQAARHPWHRVCGIEGGLIWIATSDPVDQPTLCYFEAGAIGAEALFYFKTQGPSTQAISSYLAGEKTCSGQVGQKFSLEGQSALLCTYGDGSVIEFGTLQRGLGHPANQLLDGVLTR